MEGGRAYWDQTSYAVQLFLLRYEVIYSYHKLHFHPCNYSAVVESCFFGGRGGGSLWHWWTVQPSWRPTYAFLWLVVRLISSDTLYLQYRLCKVLTATTNLMRTILSIAMFPQCNTSTRRGSSRVTAAPQNALVFLLWCNGKHTMRMGILSVISKACW